MILRRIKLDLNSNVKSIWNQIRVNGIDDADGDVVEAGVTEFGIIADGIFLMPVLHAVIHVFSYIHSQVFSLCINAEVRRSARLMRT